MTVSKDSRRTTRKTGTENTSTAIVEFVMIIVNSANSKAKRNNPIEQTRTIGKKKAEARKIDPK